MNAIASTTGYSGLQMRALDHRGVWLSPQMLNNGGCSKSGALMSAARPLPPARIPGRGSTP